MNTPNEIKKGLECCINDSFGCSEKCPYFNSLSNGVDCAVKMHKDALALIQQLEARVPKWISVEERLPEYWRMGDKDNTLINYLVYMPEYGVDVGNWLKPAKRWVVMGIPAKVTHWMPLPEPPKEDDCV